MYHRRLGADFEPQRCQLERSDPFRQNWTGKNPLWLSSFSQTRVQLTGAEPRAKFYSLFSLRLLVEVMLVLSHWPFL